MNITCRVPGLVGLKPSRSAAAASRTAFSALLLRDLTVLRKNLGVFIARTLIQPFLLVFVFLYVFPQIGQGVGGGSAGGLSSFATVLVAGVVGLSIMFQGIQAVALPLANEFGYTKEIEDRVLAPLPVSLVALGKVIAGAIQGTIAAVIVFPIASVVHATGVHPNLSVHWALLLTLIPLTCIMTSSLGLFLGTRISPRNIGVMFGFIVLPHDLPRRHLLSVDDAGGSQGRGFSLAAGTGLRQPAYLRDRGIPRGFDHGAAHAPVCDLPRARGVLRSFPLVRVPGLPQEGYRIVFSLLNNLTLLAGMTVLIIFGWASFKQERRKNNV